MFLWHILVKNKDQEDKKTEREREMRGREW